MISMLLCSFAFLLVFGVATGNALAQPGRSEPAPVPDAVAIPRPTAEEVQLAERALAEFLKTADPAVKAIDGKYPGLIAVRVPRPNSAIVPSLAPYFQAKHQNNLKVAKQEDIEVLFMGDSITDFWREEEGLFAGKPVLDKHFGHLKIANFGIAGDTTEGVLFRLQNGEGEGFSPKAIMLMIGTNNTGRNNAAEIAEGIGAVVLQMQKNFPEAKILLLAVFPRGGANDPVRDMIAEINSIISRLHDGERVHYLDIGEKFLDENGNIPKDVMSDALHPSTKGYEIWAEAVKEPLSKLLD
jgi:lysophospholipase L1-like esterase